MRDYVWYIDTAVLLNIIWTLPTLLSFAAISSGIEHLNISCDFDHIVYDVYDYDYDD